MSTKPLDQKQIEHLKQICNEADIKLTHQRLEIFKELMGSFDHPSAEVIHKRLQKILPTLAIDTVYRTLTTFNELGIIKKLHLENERTLFDANRDQHHHFICTQCKAVHDLYWEDFDKSTLPESVHGIGRIQSRHLELHGLCNKCLEESGP